MSNLLGTFDQDTSHFLSGEDHTVDANGAALPPREEMSIGPLLPPGVHPGDASTASERAPAPYDHEKPQQHRPGREPWGTDNEEALPVFQRSAHDWLGGQVWLSSQPADSSVLIVVGRQKGRVKVTIWVPLLMPNGSAPLGVLLAPTQEGLYQGGTDCIVLNLGDSVTLYTEGPVYAGLISGNATGFCQYVSLTNPLGRGRDLTF